MEEITVCGRKFHGYEIKRENNRDLFDFIERLLVKTRYGDYALTHIYKTVEKKYIMVLFKQIENEYGGYVDTVQIYITIDDIVRNVERGGE
jgi:hypothetical protein